MTLPRNLLRLALAAANGFRILSLVLIAGSLFSLGFLATYTVENTLAEPIWVTPVGAAGPEARRHPLPTSAFAWLMLPSARRGRYEVLPGQTAAFTYDMDDINFSELVVEGSAGVLGSFVVNAHPAAKRYYAPAPRRLVIKAGSLAPASSDVLDAARRARTLHLRNFLWWALVVLPWPVAAVLVRLRTHAPIERSPQN